MESSATKASRGASIVERDIFCWCVGAVGAVVCATLCGEAN
jgi:hypothetical protein